MGKAKLSKLLLALVLCLFLVGAVHAVPPQPMTLHGKVQAGGAGLPDGTSVSAWLGSTESIATGSPISFPGTGVSITFSDGCTGEVTALRQAVTLRMETVGQLSRFALAVSAVVVAIGALVVLTTMLGAVSERRQEIGLFRALGFRQQHVMRIILGEAMLVSLGGGVLGWLIGMGIAILLAPRLVEAGTMVGWNPWLALGAIGGALMVGLVGSLYPALSAARLDPTTALRSL